MNAAPSTIHGYTVEDFIEMLRSNLGLDLHESLLLLGGMSNLNLLVQNGEKQYVVKVPALQIPYDENPYDSQWAIHEVAYSHSLSTKPITKGKLDGDLPFFVTEYEAGNSKLNHTSFSDDELVSIRSALSRLSEIQLSVPNYNHPLDFLASNIMQFEKGVKNEAIDSHDFCRYSEKMEEFGNELKIRLEKLPSWQGNTMHGDFRPSNIILQKGSVKLIDFENTAQGSLYYDLAYFFVEPIGDFTISAESPLVNSKRRQTMIRRLVPLALFSCLSWTLARLIHLRMGLVESNLADAETGIRLEEYFQQKSAQLADRLELSI